MNKKISILVPLWNEADSLHALHQQISEVMTGLSQPWEIIYIDDGSTDESWKMIQEFSAAGSHIGGIRQRKNFGKAAALQAGYDHCRGDIIMTLDADLQDDPAEIPQFLKKMSEGFELVSGWKKIRHDPWHKVFPSRVFNGMVSWLTGVALHDHNCGMKAYSSAICQEIRLYGELHRFIPVLAADRGFRVGEVIIQHRPRQFGSSKYGFRRFLRGYFDLLGVTFQTRYAQRPMHYFGSWGLIFLLMVTFFVLISWIWPTSRFAFWGIVASLFATVGTLVYQNGLLSNQLAAMNPKKPYVIAEKIGFLTSFNSHSPTSSLN
ncbi:MAG: glycosyltransferase family 2 protein [Zavarzinella sp.]